MNEQGKQPPNADLSKQLARSKEQLRSIIDSSTQPIFLKNIEGEYLLINKQYERLSGATNRDIFGKTDYDVFPVHIADLFQHQDKQVLEKKKPLEFEETVPLPVVGERTFLTSKFPLYDEDGEIYAVGGSCTDITDRLKMERELLRMEKLESVGVLAGGIAHDFNNLLMAILGNISLALSLIDKQHGAYPLLEASQEASLRAKSLTQQLLTFARGGLPVLKASALDRLIKESSEFVLRGSSVKPIYELAEDLWLVNIDKGQMSQVIQNLVINARQAMPCGGTVRLTGENIESVPVDLASKLGKGHHVKITIRDHGVGIPENVLHKIFDPYFSTKREGSGLGLAITSSIIDKHKGHISVLSTPGEGTAFDIYLPASSQFAADIPEPHSKCPSSGGRVLIMDDDEAIRKTSEEMLLHLGYEVIQSDNGIESIQIYKEAFRSGNKIDVLILDLTVPGGLGGAETAKKILEFDPNAVTVVCSGYSTDPVMSDYKKHGFKASIAKPYKIDDLDILLRTLIV